MGEIATAPAAGRRGDGPEQEVEATIGLFELVLEVADLAAAERFYREVIGLSVADRWEDDRPAVWLALGREAFLGLWPRETGGERAIHRGRGGVHVHYAIRVPRGTLDAVQRRIEALGVPVEGDWEFGPGDRAIYVDDPDGNVVELTERATLWDGRAATELGFERAAFGAVAIGEARRGGRCQRRSGFWTPSDTDEAH